MQESIVFLLRVQCRRKESSRSPSHLLMSFLLYLVCEILRKFDIDSIQVRWENVQAIDVKFSQDLTQQKSLASIKFDRVIGKIKGGHFLGHSAYIKKKLQVTITLT